MSLYAVIMAGGVGSRFWPRSRQDEPKQFLPVLDSSSLIQNTFARLQPLVAPERVVVVTNARYAAQTRQHLPALDEAMILTEPVARNTAPAIAYAAAKLAALDPEATMIVLPADHVITDVRGFQRVLEAAAEKARQGTAEAAPLVTIGIEPTHPATGYGYIQYDTAAAGDGDAPKPCPVRTFAEKPDLATAERFLDAGDFLWNSGMFIWRADAVLARLERHLPAVYHAFGPVLEAARSDDEERERAAVGAAFAETPKISIDYGVMEPAAAEGGVWVVPGSFGWNDVGDWRAVYDIAGKDRAGNAVEGDVILHDSSRSYVRSENRLVVLVGVQDLAVVDTDDAVLVCHLGKTQQVKNVVDYLGSHGMEEYV